MTKPRQQVVHVLEEVDGEDVVDRAVGERQGALEISHHIDAGIGLPVQPDRVCHLLGRTTAHVEHAERPPAFDLEQVPHRVDAAHAMEYGA